MTQALEKAHFNMVEQQVRPGYVLDERVLSVLESLSRTQFIDEELHGLAYADVALPIGHGQTMLPPVLVGRLLQALQVQPTDTVLEIGTGTGYLTALLAALAAQVVSVEIYPDLSAEAATNLAQTDVENVVLQVGDASQGWPMQDRMDTIICTAAFVAVPDTYLQSLKIGGRMLAIVGEGEVMDVQLITRVSERNWQTKSVMETVVPPMVNAEPILKFDF